MTWRQLSWTADWHVREEGYVQALAGLMDAQHRQPLAAHWGSGSTSSSDAQFFRAGGRGEVGGVVNLHYGQNPGVKFYTHLSDQFGPFHTRVIAATAHEALHVLDGLLYHQSSLVINEHDPDTGGGADHVFAMCRLIGFRFAPHARLEGKATRSIAGYDRAVRTHFSGSWPDQCSHHRRSLGRTTAPRDVDQNRDGHRVGDPAQARSLSQAEWSGLALRELG